MEQRTYRGNVDPEGLADYLVSTFDQGYNTVAQKVGQGNQFLVQVGHGRYGGRNGIRHAIGVSIVRNGDDVNVAVGQSNWLDLATPGLVGTLFASIWFPPLLIFPLLRGIRNFAIYGQIWDAVETYCTQRGATQAQTTVAHGVTCPHCGVLNHENAQFCSTCGTPLTPPQPAATAQAVCAECHQTVPIGRYCGNCGAALTPSSV